MELFAPFAGERPRDGSGITPQPPVPPTAPARCTGPQQPPQHVWLWDINLRSCSPFQALCVKGWLAHPGCQQGGGIENWSQKAQIPSPPGPGCPWPLMKTCVCVLWRQISVGARHC